MFMTGKKIGSLVTERKVKGDVEMYSLVSTADVSILWKAMSAHTVTNLVFKGGVLTESYYEHKENGVVEKYCKLSEDGNGGYAVHHWKKGKFNVSPLASFCLINIYYTEPKDGQKMFSESFGEYITIKKTGPGTYEIKDPAGEKSVYHYTDGRLTETEFHTSIVTVKLKPKA